MLIVDVCLLTIYGLSGCIVDFLLLFPFKGRCWNLKKSHLAWLNAELIDFFGGTSCKNNFDISSPKKSVNKHVSKSYLHIWKTWSNISIHLKMTTTTGCKFNIQSPSSSFLVFWNPKRNISCSSYKKLHWVHQLVSNFVRLQLLSAVFGKDTDESGESEPKQ